MAGLRCTSTASRLQPIWLRSKSTVASGPSAQGDRKAAGYGGQEGLSCGNGDKGRGSGREVREKVVV